MTNQLAETADRIQAVDVIQGLALLGMLLVHSQTDSLSGFLQAGPVAALPPDQAEGYTPALFFLQLLVEGPFEGLLSVGVGWRFYQQWQKRERAGSCLEGPRQAGWDADRVTRRRLVLLLCLGLVLGFGFGNLLYQVAGLGFTLVYFRRQSVTTLVRWLVGLAALVIFIQFIHLLVLSPSLPSLAASKQPRDAEAEIWRQLGLAWLSGPWPADLRLPSIGELMRQAQSIGSGLVWYVQLELMLLLGLIVGKLRLFDRLSEERVRLSLLLLLLFPLAFGLKGVSSLAVLESPLLPVRWQTYEPLLFVLSNFLGTPLLTLVYLLEIGLNLTPFQHPVVVWIGQVGRMSLTNYLLQSGLSRLLYAHAGLGLSGILSPLESVGVTLVLYGLQVGFSQWWLGHYRQGPLEWLLNRLTNGQPVTRPSTPVN